MFFVTYHEQLNDQRSICKLPVTNHVIRHHHVVRNKRQLRVS